jgi:di/tricarboxylate transporter
MTLDQVAISALLVLLLALFAWGRWRHDLVAFAILLAAVVLGLVPAAGAFAGFGHPAVVTVAVVLVLSRALAVSGAVDRLAVWLPSGGPAALQIGAFCGVAAALSAFMNNVGALALLMPVAIQAAKTAGRSPGSILMPLAYASILGGLVTLIGTPPNLIVAEFRARAAGEPFAMFDFAPVGGAVALVGVAFIALVGWRLLPLRTGATAPADFDLADSLAEGRIPAGGKLVGRTLSGAEAATGDREVQIVGLVRGGRAVPSAPPWERLQEGDILLLEAAAEELDGAVAALGLELAGDPGKGAAAFESGEVALEEAVVMPQALIAGLTAQEIRLRTRYGVSLLAVAREGRPYRGPLKRFRFAPGDVLLLRGEAARLAAAIATLGCVPLAERERPGRPRTALLATALALAGVAISAAGLLPAPIALSLSVAAILLAGILPLREAYASIDWSVIVLLGAMIPIGAALETTGTTRLVADVLVALSGGAPPVVALGLVLVVTMALSDLVNNAATAVTMAPIAVSVAAKIGADADPFLMAVAIGASCAFLTPIGHQNNILVLGPGGYHFGDYWRMGLPLEALILVLSLLLLPIVWPF